MPNGLRGRPRVEYIPRAIALIEASEHYLSLFEIAKLLALGKSQKQSLRRSLKKAEDEGRIVNVGIAHDGSFAWARAPRRGTDIDRAATCAAHAAEVFLDKQLGKRSLDIQKTALAICESISTAATVQETTT